MGTTLGSGSGLDQDKTLACRTLGTPPRHAWRTVAPHSDDHAAHWSRQDASAISARARVSVTRGASGPLSSS